MLCCESQRALKYCRPRRLGKLSAHTWHQHLFPVLCSLPHYTSSLSQPLSLSPSPIAQDMHPLVNVYSVLSHFKIQWTSSTIMLCDPFQFSLCYHDYPFKQFGGRLLIAKWKHTFYSPTPFTAHNLCIANKERAHLGPFNTKSGVPWCLSMPSLFRKWQELSQIIVYSMCSHTSYVNHFSQSIDFLYLS